MEPGPNIIMVDWIQNPSAAIESIVDTTLSGAEMPSFKSPCGPNCIYHIVFNGPRFTCEPSSNLVLSVPSDFQPSSDFDSSSWGVLLNSSALQDQLPATWITPASPIFLTRSTVPIYAAASATLSGGSAPTLWIQYSNNDSASPITTPSTFPVDSLRVNQTGRTIACNLQNSTYSLNVVSENNVSAVSMTNLSVTSLLAPNPSGWGTSFEDFFSPFFILLSRLAGYVFAEKTDNPKSMLGPYSNNTQILSSSIIKMSGPLITEPSRPSSDGESEPVMTEAFTWSVTRPLESTIPESLTYITLNMVAASPATSKQPASLLGLKFYTNTNQDSLC